MKDSKQIIQDEANATMKALAQFVHIVGNPDKMSMEKIGEKKYSLICYKLKKTPENPQGFSQATYNIDLP